MSDRGGSFAQWPVLAAAWCLHAILVLGLFVRLTDFERTSPSRWLPLVIGLLALVALEAILLIFANAVVEGALSPLGRWTRVAGDAAKSLFLASALTLTAASIAKFEATGLHLKRSDLWFARNNFRQLLAEGLPSEVFSLLALPLGGAATAVLLFVGLRCARTRPASAAWKWLVGSTVLCMAALTWTYSVSPAFTRFLEEIVPETRWAVRTLNARGAGSAPDDRRPEISLATGRPIVPYRPEQPTAALDAVVLMLESINWSHVEERPEATPNLRALMKESVVFKRAYTTSTHSDYAQMAILSSLHPRKFDHHDFYVQLDYPRTLLWDALEPAGYTTSMFSCQNERWGNMLNYLDTPGLDVLRHSPDWPNARHKGAGPESKVHEETPVEEWRAWVGSGQRAPYFAYLNFQSNHFPYEIPPEEPRPFVPHDIDFSATFVRYPVEKAAVMRNRFDNALLYADRWVGRVVGSLHQTGAWDRTVLLVVSDHGEAFYEHDQPTHGTSLYEEQVRSFLAIRAPGLEHRVVDEPVSLLDVAPTLLRLVGLPPHANFQGRDDILEEAYSASGRPFLFTIQGLAQQDGLLRDDWKLIVDYDRDRSLLFDLTTDPFEKDNLVDREVDLAQELRAELDGLLESQISYYAARGWEGGLYPPRLP